jgi:hypothetical protein
MSNHLSIRELSDSDMEVVTGGKNEKVGETVVNSMWNTIIAVEGILAKANNDGICGLGITDCPHSD